MNDLVHLYFHITGGVFWIKFLKVKVLGQTVSEHVVLQDITPERLYQFDLLPAIYVNVYFPTALPIENVIKFIDFSQ